MDQLQQKIAMAPANTIAPCHACEGHAFHIAKRDRHHVTFYNLMRGADAGR